MAIYYIDNTRGNDSNNGTSPETAWKNLTQIATITPSAGDQFLLEENSIWEYRLSTRVVFPVGSSGTKTNPVIVSNYSFNGTTPVKKPIIRWFNDIAISDWTYSAPDNAWVYTAPFAIGNLCYLRLNDTWNTCSRIDTGVPLASKKGRYHNSGTTLYLYAPSTQTPTEFYGKVTLSLTDTGFFTISSGRGAITIQNITFENMGMGVLAYSGTAVDVFATIKNCVANNISRVFGATGDTAGQLNFECYDNVITNYGPVAISAITSSNIGIKSCKIYNNKIDTGGWHYSQGAIYLQTRAPLLTTFVYNNTISNALHGTEDKIYDGCAIYCETGCDNVKVFNNTIVNCYTAFIDNSGRSTEWYNNLLINCYSVMWSDDDLGNNLTNHSFYNNTCFVGAPLTPIHGNGTANIGWRNVNDGAAGGTLNIRNNIFYNINETAAAEAAIIVPNIAFTGNIENNVVYNFTSVCKQNYTPFADVSTTGTITTKPNFTPGNTPKLGSNLVAAGKFVRYFPDRDGKLFNNPPSIGAYEYIPERPEATIRGVR